MLEDLDIQLSKTNYQSGSITDNDLTLWNEFTVNHEIELCHQILYGYHSKKYNTTLKASREELNSEGLTMNKWKTDWHLKKVIIPLQLKIKLIEDELANRMLTGQCDDAIDSLLDFTMESEVLGGENV